MKPNILFIMADQFRADALGCMGAPVKTPNLDALAREGMLFANCCTVAPLCAPARIALFTGKYPHTTTLWDNELYVLSPEADLWSKEIRAQGYATAMIGKAHLHADRGDVIGMEYLMNGYGFDYVDEISGPHATLLTRTHMREEWERLGLFEAFREDVESRGRKPFARPSSLPLEEYYDVYVGREGKRWLESYYGEQPWFCHVSFCGPHEPWDAPEPYASMYDPAEIPAPLPEMRSRCDTRPQGEWDRLYQTLQHKHCCVAQAQEICANYYGNVTLIDQLIGELLDTVRARGEWERTVVVFTSDHGELNGDHGFINKRNFFDSVLKVPLIIRTPGMTARTGSVSNALVSLMDVGPTLAEYAGKQLEYKQFGQSLCALTAGKTDTHRSYILSEYAGECMYMDERWKLVVNPLGQPYMLFDRQRDPQEIDNLAGDPAFAETEKELCLRLMRAIFENQTNKPSLTQITWKFNEGEHWRFNID